MSPVSEVSPFARDKTSELIKKYIVYRAMGSDFFINYSLSAVHLSYKILGTRLTNAIIENTGGAIFTGGVTTNNVKQLQKSFL